MHSRESHVMGRKAYRTESLHEGHLHTASGRVTTLLKLFVNFGAGLFFSRRIAHRNLEDSSEQNESEDLRGEERKRNSKGNRQHFRHGQRETSPGGRTGTIGGRTGNCRSQGGGTCRTCYREATLFSVATKTSFFFLTS